MGLLDSEDVPSFSKGVSMNDQVLIHAPRQETASQSPSKPRRMKPGELSLSHWQVRDKIAGRYEVQAIKKGGMGIVYLCYDHESRKPIVLKTFQDIFFSEKTEVERFMWEAETWVRLEKHPNIVRAYYVERIEDKPYIILECIAGEDPFGPELSGWIRGKGLTLTLSLNFAIQFCSGMLHAQKKFETLGKAFVHRDIKPNNIMVTQNRILKVTDFGLVKAFQAIRRGRKESRPGETGGRENHSLTRIDSYVGTPAYMAPEQWRGEDIDTRADIYAFGCVLYRMLGGSCPFTGASRHEYRIHHLETPPQPIPGISPSLNFVILKCLEKKREKRFQSFREIREELQAFYHDRTDEYVEIEEEGEELEDWELLNKGISLDNLGHHREAIQSYEQAIRLSPQNARVYNNRGTAYRALGQYDPALKDYDRAIQLNPRYPHAYNNRGLVYLVLGQPEKAIQDFDMVIQLHPWYSHAYNNRALGYRALGQHQNALRDFDQAIRLNPQYVDAHYNRALVLERAGLREALDAWRSYLQVAKDIPREKILEVRRRLEHWKEKVQK